MLSQIKKFKKNLSTNVRNRRKKIIKKLVIRGEMDHQPVVDRNVENTFLYTALSENHKINRDN